MNSLPFTSLLVLALHLTISLPAQSRREHCVMFYNAENLFHPSNDSAVADDDFTPEGVRRWNFYRYNRKIAAVCKVILAVNGWEPPDVVCLSEIENMLVLNDIIFHPLMLGQRYFPLHRDSPDHRGIDVGMLYRGDRLECLDTAWIEIRKSTGELVPTREILSATFRLRSTGDTVVICANHWTSKYGGALETEEKRLLQSRLLGEYIESLTSHPLPGPENDTLPGAGTSSSPASHGLSALQRFGVIAGGDLNDLSGSAPVQMLTDTFHLEEVFPERNSPTVARNGDGAENGDRAMIRIGRGDAPKPQASYKYQGNWGSIDHVFVGGSLHAMDCRARVFSHQLLLEEDLKYTGVKPFRTYSGFSYIGGFSDHLPLLLYFVVQEEQVSQHMDHHNDWENLPENSAQTVQLELDSVWTDHPKNDPEKVPDNPGRKIRPIQKNDREGG